MSPLFMLLLLVVHSLADFPDIRASKPGHINSFAGPFKVIVKKFENCPVEMIGRNAYRLTGTVKQTRAFPDPRFTGNFENVEPCDDGVVFEIALSSWNNVRGWTPNAFKLNLGKLCIACQGMFKPFVDFLEQHEVTGKEKMCPRQPGNFTIKDLPLFFAPSKFVAFPYGRYRGDLHFFRDKEKVSCIRSIIETVPLITGHS